MHSRKLRGDLASLQFSSVGEGNIGTGYFLFYLVLILFSVTGGSVGVMGLLSKCSFLKSQIYFYKCVFPISLHIHDWRYFFIFFWECMWDCDAAGQISPQLILIILIL